ncbi:uncharacterized protein BYT42DRAFT_562754 [Radiomyces spectabilis]|uniref:uncharacterized protein n=1 Tax=Radiomyces spectabilis TaxID=64574 RepID=UPI00221E3A95|nr:uncharacterized protein BYT42DRAFT_562754 [Radiomyces spectabilis]KAI8384514.1 hypothetical protein BYT42DRAFT_562754 [Radiomyces spectabilis]
MDRKQLIDRAEQYASEWLQSNPDWVQRRPEDDGTNSPQQTEGDKARSLNIRHASREAADELLNMNGHQDNQKSGVVGESNASSTNQANMAPGVTASSVEGANHLGDETHKNNPSSVPASSQLGSDQSTAPNGEVHPSTSMMSGSQHTPEQENKAVGGHSQQVPHHQQGEKAALAAGAAGAAVGAKADHSMGGGDHVSHHASNDAGVNRDQVPSQSHHSEKLAEETGEPGAKRSPQHQDPQHQQPTGTTMAGAGTAPTNDMENAPQNAEEAGADDKEGDGDRRSTMEGGSLAKANDKTDENLPNDPNAKKGKTDVKPKNTGGDAHHIAEQAEQGMGGLTGKQPVGKIDLKHL